MPAAIATAPGCAVAPSRRLARTAAAVASFSRYSARCSASSCESDPAAPAGVDTDDYLTLRGQGNVGPRAGSRGDLLAVIEVEPDSRFARRGADLIHDLPITFSQAAIGATIEIPTVTNSVKVNVPPGVQTGHVIQLRGKGLPHLRRGGTGDLIVRVVVVTPRNLTPEQREVFEALAEIEGPADPGEDGSGFWQKVKEAFFE
jgi:molecular chaperone DnaJ